MNIKVKILFIIIGLFTISGVYAQEGDMSKMSDRQVKEYWKKKKKEEKAHKKKVKEYQKKNNNTTEYVSGQNVYKRMKRTKFDSNRLNNKKHRNPFMKKNKRLDRDPLYKRLLYKLRKNKDK